MSRTLPSAPVVAIQPTLGKVNAQPKSFHEQRGSVIKQKKLTAKDFVKVLVKLEPIRQRAKEEEEHRQAKQEQAYYDARRVPDFTCGRRNEVVLGQAKSSVKNSERR